MSPTLLAVLVLGVLQPQLPTRGFALLELFLPTEGCRETPPTAWVQALHDQARREGSTIEVIVSPVSLGNSSAASTPPGTTDRLAAYAQANAIPPPALPLLVLNGTRILPLGEPAAAREAIHRALADGVPAPLRARASLHERSIRVSCEVSLPESVDIVSNARLHAVLVEVHPSAATRHLVARARATTSPGDQPQRILDLPLPEDLPLERARIVVFVQHARTLQVLGAVGTVLRPENP